MDFANSTSLIDNFPLKAQLYSNYIPTDPEIQEVKAFLLHPIARIRLIDDELIDLENRLKALRNERKGISHQVEICQAIITLPRRLPDDILREIFYQSLPTNVNAAMVNSVPPLIFTQICKRWREVALSTPKLWSTIHIHVVQRCGDEHFTDSNGVVDFESKATPGEWDKKRAADAVEWLGRSGQRSLSISVVGDEVWGGPSPAFYDLQLSSIIPFAARWRNMFLAGRPESFSSLAAIKAVDLPCLNSLFLDFNAGFHWRGGLQETWKNCGLLTAPSLRKLSLRQNSMDISITALNIAWSQLTHLDLGSLPNHPSSWFPSIVLASKVLRLCERLVYCKTDLGDTDRMHEIMPMPLPVLRKLVIKTEDNIARFIEKLHAPELTCVDLTFVKHSKPFISNLLQKRKIRKLSISTRYSLHSSFLDSLRKCPTLISLTIKRDSATPDLESERNTFTLDDKFLRLLSDDNDPLCPHLEELIYESIIEFTIGGMVEFIRRKQADRNLGLAKLKTISVSNLQSDSGSDSNSDSDLEGNNGDSELEAFTAWKDSEEVERYIADGLKIQHWQPEVVDWDSPTEEHDDDLLISFGNSSAQYCDSWLE